MVVQVTMIVPEETIEKIRNSLDIVEVVGEYVQLKKQGRNYFGLCPFHNEHTPSFSVAPEKQIFHCFGCGIGGNIFTFVMEIEGLSFIESVQHLGEKAKIDLPELTQNKGDKGRNDEREILFNAHNLLTKFYHYCLTETKYGERARSYLQDRGFTKATIDTFQLGYAVDSWETTTKFLQKRQFQLNQLVTSGLLSKRDFDGKFFDRFRNRVMFPIWDRHGKPIAFGGRVLVNEKPKYLNSPESNIFHKGSILYAYHLARQSIKQHNQAVLFEGYVDVIKAHQAGITNAVASLGTSLTEEQAGLLTRLAETIIICYDSDSAGIEATFRAAKLLEGFESTIKIASMPSGLDPDDYISQFGGEKFKTDVIGASQTVMAFKMQYFRTGKNLQDEGDQMRYIEEVLEEIARLTKAVERDHYLRQLSEEFSLSLDALKQQQFQAYKRQQKNQNNHRGKQPNTKPTISRQRQIVHSQRLKPAFQVAEMQLLAHMMRNDEIAKRVQESIGGAFNIESHQALAAYIFAFYEEGKEPDISGLIQRLDDESLQHIATEIAMMQINEQLTEQELSDYIQQVENYKELLVIQKKEEEKKEAIKVNNIDLAAKLTMEIINMKKALKK